jgi:hypothetical protein
LTSAEVLLHCKYGEKQDTTGARPRAGQAVRAGEADQGNRAGFSARSGRAAEPGPKFILKGAILFSLWTGEMHRPTRDLDLLGSGKPDAQALHAIFHNLASIAHDDDGLTFFPGSVAVDPIREDQEYGGERITLIAKLGNSRIHLQVDVGFGDAVTPAAGRRSANGWSRMPINT